MVSSTMNDSLMTEEGWNNQKTMTSFLKMTSHIPLPGYQFLHLNNKGNLPVLMVYLPAPQCCDFLDVYSLYNPIKVRLK